MYEHEMNNKRFCERFEKALEIKYPTLKECHRRGRFVAAFDRDYESDKSIKTVIDGWFSAKETMPSLENLRRICNFLDCDIDFFYDDTDTFCKSVNNASQTTGLSEGAINSIRKMDKEALLVLTILLENGKMESILQAINDMNSSVGSLNKKDVSTGKIKTMEISQDMKDYAYTRSIIKDSKSVLEDKRYNEYKGEVFLNNRGAVPFQKPVTFEHLKDIKKERITFNEAIELEDT